MSGPDHTRSGQSGWWSGNACVGINDASLTNEREDQIPYYVVESHLTRRLPIRVQTWLIGGRSGRDVGHLGVPGRSKEGGRDELTVCCPARVSRSLTRSSKCVIVNRCFAIVARSSTTSACKVATTDGTTRQNVQ